MSHEKRSFESLFHRNPDIVSGSNKIFFEGNFVYKVLLDNAPIYQFCAGDPPEKVIHLLRSVENLVKTAFGDMILHTKYIIIDGKIITVQKKLPFNTLYELAQSEDNSNSIREQLKKLEEGVKKLREIWKLEDRELLGFTIDEIMNPKNIIFDGDRFILIDW